MRIVPNLNDIDECPNCESRGLISNHNKWGRLYKLCPVCHEEIFENETTCSEEQHTVYCVKQITNTKEKRLNQKREKKESFIFEMREEISALDWCSHDAKTQTLVENIQNILNRIIDYIEEN